MGGKGAGAHTLNSKSHEPLPTALSLPQISSPFATDKVQRRTSELSTFGSMCGCVVSEGLDTPRLRRSGCKVMHVRWAGGWLRGKAE